MPTDNFWNGLITAASSMYASNKKKKADNKQLDFMNSILEDKRRYENEKIDRYKSSPGAQMSPMIMEMLVKAYGPQFAKYGVDMPLDKMLGAINGNGGGGGSSAGGGGGGAGGYKSTLSDIASGKEPNQGRTLSDMLAAQLGKSNEYERQTGIKVRRGVNPEIEGYNGKTWINDTGGQEGGASAGSYGSREQTRSPYGSGFWKDGKYTSVGATGNLMQYQPQGETTTTQWQDPQIHNSGFEEDGFEYDTPGSTLDPIRPSPEDVLNGKSPNGDGWLKNFGSWLVDHVPGKAAGGAIGGPFGLAAGEVFDYGKTRNWFGPGKAYMGKNPGKG